jgi:GDP-L-fucose synthase
MFEISDRRILITGGDSMLGRAIFKKLHDMEAQVYRITHKMCDLLDWEETFNLIYTNKPHYIIHCAGYNGNISFNKKFPAEIYHKTMQMGLNVLSASASCGVKKVVSLISSCAYPDLGDGLLKEEDFWKGEPNKSVDAHGFAKRGLLEYGRQIHKQYGMLCVGMCVNTCYGPYDNFSVEKTKVVGGLIKKFSDAKRDNIPFVDCWGTGMARREFIYAEDVGKYLAPVLESYDNSEYPINIGSGIDYTIKELAHIVKKSVEYEGEIKWDEARPDGQMRKLLSNDKMKSLFGELKFTPLEVGIDRTVEWYNENV